MEELRELITVVSKNKITNVHFIPRQPASTIKSFLDAADVLLIHLKENPIALIGIPQKTQAYLAIGKPILMAVRGEAANLVKKSNAGIVCEPENPDTIADNIRKLFLTPSEKLSTIGKNGRKFYENELSFFLFPFLTSLLKKTAFINLITHDTRSARSHVEQEACIYCVFSVHLLHFLIFCLLPLPARLLLVESKRMGKELCVPTSTPFGHVRHQNPLMCLLLQLGEYMHACIVAIPSFIEIKTK